MNEPTKALLPIKQPEALWSKKQKEFKQLSVALEKAEAELSSLRSTIEHYRSRRQLELTPLQKVYAECFQEMVQKLDQWYRSGVFAPHESKHLASIIIEYTTYLMHGSGTEALKNLYLRYWNITNQEKPEDNRTLGPPITPTEEQGDTGTTLDETIPLADESKAWSPEEKLADRARREQERLRLAIRKLYLRLIKEFHPDLELDERLKEEKTAKVQEITAAYRNEDLKEMLNLQLSLETVHLESSSKVLNHYIKGYKRQLERLTERLSAERENLAVICQIDSVHTLNPKAIEIQFQTNINQVKKEIRTLKAYVRAIQDPQFLRQEIAHRIQSTPSE
ncbi:hypothetical protein CLV98_104234 [Dyadobacter jejuensis]|uniref:DnaJ-like protein n=1 Tax=Dyadobacter jejuensis TaxID=1082580 RepID=A0A316AKR3_9BACT|nr:J domain-containing protein [Dyadobacter jejuensis]PWJ58375.1 hypothetical protein CLV98_104234 [Dyadobacter jejuensis]